MSFEYFESILRKNTAEKEICITQIREQSENRISEAIARVETELLKRCDSEISEFERDLESRTRDEVVKHLCSVARDINKRSTTFQGVSSKNRLPISFIYGHMCDVLPSTIGILVPTDRVTPDNGEGYLCDRIKAVALETILKAKNLQNNIVDISMVGDGELTVFKVDYERPLRLLSGSGFTSAFEETLDLDGLFEIEFSSDDILSRAGIVYTPSMGVALNNISLQDIPSIAEIISNGREYQFGDTGGLLTELATIDMIFRLDLAHPDYESRHQVASLRFQEELSIGTFKDTFNNFRMTEGTSGNMYHVSAIALMLRGTEEQIRGSGDMFTVRCEYVIPVDDPGVQARFFPFGVYSEEDAKKKYQLTDQKLRCNFEEEGNFDPGKMDVIVVTTPEGLERRLYRAEDLQRLTQKRKR